MTVFIIAWLFPVFLAVLNSLISHVARYAPSSWIQNISKIWDSIVPIYFFTITKYEYLLIICQQQRLCVGIPLMSAPALIISWTLIEFHTATVGMGTCTCPLLGRLQPCRCNRGIVSSCRDIVDCSGKHKDSCYHNRQLSKTKKHLFHHPVHCFVSCATSNLS